ncbi:MAG TPA: hypothetical protein VM638_06235, partial [Actinomycetota bacterium]|nr:hypothetical protein [Actinomycetota bacterium]
LFDGFQRLGLAEYRLDLGSVAGDLATDRERRRYGGEVRILHVEERSRLRGLDPQPAVEDLYLTFVRRGGRWLVASDRDLEDVGLLSARRLWEIGPVEARREGRFVYVAHPEVAEAAAAVIGSAEPAMQRVVERWPRPWHRRVAIIAPRDTDQLGRLIQATFDLDAFVAFAASGVERGADWDLVGHRILLNWPSFSSHAEGSRERILTHELLHVATREDAGPMIPIFVEEGLAEWVTDERSGDVLGAVPARFDGRLPLDHEFTTGTPGEIRGAYLASASAIGYAVERFGIERTVELYRRLGAVRREPGTWRYHTDRAMREAWGVGYRRFERDWVRWVNGARADRAA